MENLELPLNARTNLVSDMNLTLRGTCTKFGKESMGLLNIIPVRNGLESTQILS